MARPCPSEGRVHRLPTSRPHTRPTACPQPAPHLSADAAKVRARPPLVHRHPVLHPLAGGGGVGHHQAGVQGGQQSLQLRLVARQRCRWRVSQASLQLAVQRSEDPLVDVVVLQP